MLQLFIAAFTIGIVGSFHCVGMCGPLAFTLPLSGNNLFARLGGSLLYNLGRVFTYALLGLLFGSIGQTAALFGFQQWLSIAAGATILIFILLPHVYKAPHAAASYTSNIFSKLRSALAGLFSKKSSSSLFVIGLLNGLLPCGLVYMAVAGAIATGSSPGGSLFMAAFGLGTLPVMWSVAFFGNYAGLKLRQRIRRFYPYMMALMACLLILRGMGLGIPYVSPKMDAQKTQVHGCCSKHNQ